MDRDRNLLFGVLAVQLNKITPRQLVDVAGTCCRGPDLTASLSPRATVRPAALETATAVPGEPARSLVSFANAPSKKGMDRQLPC